MKFSPIFLSSAILFQTIASSATIDERLENIIDLKVGEEQISTLKRLEETHKLPTKRPEFCPLNTTETYKKTVESLKALTVVFADNCLDSNQTLVGQLLDSSKSLESELNDLAEQQGKDKTDKVKTLDDVEVDGIPVSQIMNGMNTLFSTNKCSNLDRRTFLEKSADVIQTFSQIGLYSETGAKYAYGGLAVSSILRFVNSIFEKRFEFEKEEDIQTFVKLNCAYYDIRNEVKAQEVFRIDTKKHYRDKIVVEKLKSQLEKRLDDYSSNIEKLLKELEAQEKDFLTNVGGELQKVIASLDKKIPSSIIDQPGKSAKYQQAEILGSLYFQIDLLNELLADYINSSEGPERFLNILFKNRIEMVRDSEELMSMSVKDFNDKFLNDISSSFKRVLRDIENKKEEARKQFQDKVIAQADNKSFTVKNIKDYLESKKKLQTEESFNKTLERVSFLDRRLERFVNRNEYSSKDSSNGGVRQIVEMLDVAENHVYGGFGKEFLDSTKERASQQNKNFVEQFVNIQEEYLDIDGKYVRIRDRDTMNEDELRNACVDIKTARKVWVYSQSLSELGYDFLATNSDIIGDTKNVKDRKIIKKHDKSTRLARRIISAKNYKKKYENYLELGEDKIEIEGETLSMSEAREIIGLVDYFGKTYSIEEATELLNDDFANSASRFNYLGPVVLKIYDNKPRAVFLQEMYDKYSCDTVSAMTR